MSTETSGSDEGGGFHRGIVLKERAGQGSQQ